MRDFPTHRLHNEDEPIVAVTRVNEEGPSENYLHDPPTHQLHNEDDPIVSVTRANETASSSKLPSEFPIEYSTMIPAPVHEPVSQLKDVQEEPGEASVVSFAKDDVNEEERRGRLYSAVLRSGTPNELDEEQERDLAFRNYSPSPSREYLKLDEAEPIDAQRLNEAAVEANEKFFAAENAEEGGSELSVYEPSESRASPFPLDGAYDDAEDALLQPDDLHRDNNEEPALYNRNDAFMPSTGLLYDQTQPQQPFPSEGLAGQARSLESSNSISEVEPVARFAERQQQQQPPHAEVYAVPEADDDDGHVRGFFVSSGEDATQPLAGGEQFAGSDKRGADDARIQRSLVDSAPDDSETRRGVYATPFGDVTEPLLPRNDGHQEEEEEDELAGLGSTEDRLSSEKNQTTTTGAIYAKSVRPVAQELRIAERLCPRHFSKRRRRGARERRRHLGIVARVVELRQAPSRRQ